MKPYKLKRGDKVAIVSLSSGVLGEEFIKHELEIGIRRLKEFGLEPVIMPHALRGIEYIKEHPEKRAYDLKHAFMDKEVKMIIAAIGGNDTYKTISYLMGDAEFVEALNNNPKIFTGFSDTTINHLMLNKMGLSTFYGPAFLTDLCELDNNMLEYTLRYFNKFFEEESDFEIESSPIWYLDRIDYSVKSVGIPRVSMVEEHGYETLNGNGVKNGYLFGGCIESLYDLMVGESYGEEDEIAIKYNLIPTLEEWNDKILFLETSEEKTKPQKLEKILNEFKKRGILEHVRGIIVGKPYDEVYYEEYKNVFKNVFKNLETPVLYNVNFGHSYPRCIIPYDALSTVDFDNKKIYINSNILETNREKQLLKNK